ncbi:MAG: cytochrome c oxidase, subunit [Gemmatimonadetes bacterium]|nr:cytochrome c oxidase, subunit [Gemmatimonadota bacterium]
MPFPSRPRRLLAAALPAILAVAFTACSTQYPNSIFTGHTENNRDVGNLFKILIYLGTFVFIFVEGILLYTIFKYRRRSENDRPKHVHGNTTLEILWTAIPALILAFIAVPTVRVIFKSQAKATADALNVQVIGHQWWWEFRYPQYTTTGAGGKVDTLITANEVYLPVGRKVNFSLTSQDVIHSFSIPQLAGKRDLMANRLNHLWFTPDSVTENAWNGFCAEYCGSSHANMHFKVLTVTPANFESWAAHQLTPAAFGAVAAAVAPAPAATAAATDTTKVRQEVPTPPKGGSQLSATPTTGPGGTNPATAPTAAHDMSTMGATPVQQAGFVNFPREKMPAHTMPTTPLPAGLAFNESLKGDPERGRDFLTKMGGGCVGCHRINGNPMMMGTIGPNLTHIASRSTIAGGIYPNDTKHLSLWIKNARRMKPGVLMPTLGAGEYDGVTRAFIPKTGLNDQQIADIVAYLQALK